MNGIKALLESKGKPCCINMITAEDKKFIESLEKKDEKPKAEPVEEEAPAEGEEGEKPEEVVEEEEDVDELTKLIREEEKANAEHK